MKRERKKERKKGRIKRSSSAPRPQSVRRGSSESSGSESDSKSKRKTTKRRSRSINKLEEKESPRPGLLRPSDGVMREKSAGSRDRKTRIKSDTDSNGRKAGPEAEACEALGASPQGTGDFAMTIVSDDASVSFADSGSVELQKYEESIVPPAAADGTRGFLVYALREVQEVLQDNTTAGTGTSVVKPVAVASANSPAASVEHAPQGFMVHIEGSMGMSTKAQSVDDLRTKKMSKKSLFRSLSILSMFSGDSQSGAVKPVAPSHEFPVVKHLSMITAAQQRPLRARDSLQRFGSGLQAATMGTLHRSDSSTGLNVITQRHKQLKAEYFYHVSQAAGGTWAPEMQWDTIAFSGRAQRMGVFYHNHAYTIAERMSQLAKLASVGGGSLSKTATMALKEDMANSLFSGSKQYAYNVTESTDPLALERCVRVMVDEPVTAVSAGASTLGLVTATGGLYIAGAFSVMGPVCLGQPASFSAPRSSSIFSCLDESEKLEEIDCGTYHNAAITQAGTLITWGANMDANISEGNSLGAGGKHEITGQLGHRELFSPPRPISVPIVPGKETVIQVACGRYHTLVLTTAGMFSFGDNRYGQLCRRSKIVRDDAVTLIPNSRSWKCVAIACGDYHCLALCADGTVIAWGLNTSGQIGCPIVKVRVDKPTQVASVSSVVAIACGSSHSAALTSSGELFTWGSNRLGELGLGAQSTLEQSEVAQQVDVPEVVTVSCGAHSTIVTTACGVPYVWGCLSSENLSQHQRGPRMLPSPVERGLFIARAVAGITHYVLLEDDHVSRALRTLKESCLYQGVHSVMQLKLQLMSLPAPSRLLKPLQDRVMQDQLQQRGNRRKVISVNNATIVFNFETPSSVTRMITVTNPTKKKVTVKAVISLQAGQQSMFQIDCKPAWANIGKMGEKEFSITIKPKLGLTKETVVMAHFIASKESRQFAVATASRFYFFLHLAPFGSKQSDLEGYKRIVKEDYRYASVLVQALMEYVPRTLLPKVEIETGMQEPVMETFPAAVLFLDISGFTHLTHRLDLLGDSGPDLVSKHLNNYFGQLIRTVEKFGGDLVKSAGDALMCMFGKPRLNMRSRREDRDADLEDNVEEEVAEEEPLCLRDLARVAINCGLAVEKNHSRYDSGDGFELTLHIGIGAGDVSYMLVGGVNRSWEYVIAGEAILQLKDAVDNSSGSEVVVSSECWQLVQPYFTAMEKGAAFQITGTVPSEELGPSLPRTTVHQLPVSSEGLLRCFVRPSVQAKLDSGADDWVNEMRTVTSLFISLISLESQQLGVEDYFRLLNDSVQIIQTEVFKEEGVISQCLQDDKGTIVFVAFGLPPFSHADDPVRGVRTAISCYRRLASAGVRCAAGIGTGQAFAGAVGSKTRREYTTLGDSVNMAARLMGTAKKLGRVVLCDQATCEPSALSMQFHELDPVTVKGKSEPMRVFEPVWAEDKTVASTASDFTVNLVGRGVEQHLLTEHLIGLRSQMFLGSQLSRRGVDKEGRPTFEAKTVVLEGEPGMGKTALVDKMVHIARISSITVLAARCEAIHVLTPFFVWRKILYDLLFEDDRSPREALAELEAVVGAAWLPYLPLLQSVVALPFSSDSIQQFEELSSEATRAQIINLITHIIAERSAQLPMLIVIENGQWIDSSSLNLFMHLQRSVCTPLLVFVTRAVPADKWEQFSTLVGGRCVDHIKLGPLSNIECLDIVASHLGIKRFPDEVLSMITKAQGNPLFCLELVSMLRSSSRVKISNGECHISGALNVSLPSTMGALISSRMDLLSAPAQTIIKIASVIGSEFTVAQLQHMTGLSTAVVSETLGLLVRQQFVEILHEEGTYAFANPHIPEVAYSRVLVTRRKELHLQIAAWLEENMRDDPLLPTVLAYHYDAVISGDKNAPLQMVKKTVGLLQQAAEKAKKQCATEEATAMLQRAMKLNERIPEGGGTQLKRSLKLQLMGLPVRKLDEFGWDANKSPASLRVRSRKSLPANKVEAPPIPTPPKSTQIEGELKYKSLLNNWSTAYFVLSDVYLLKFESKAKYDAGKKPQRSIPITLAAIEDASELTKKPYTFAILRRNCHTIYLRAADRKDMQAWLKCLQKYSQIPTMSVTADHFIYAAVVISSERGKIIDVSSKLVDMFGYSREELIGSPVSMMMPASIGRSHDYYIRSYHKSEDRKLIGRARRVTGRHKDGRNIQVIICLGEYFDGLQRRFIASFRQELNLPDELQLNYKRQQPGYFSDDSDVDWSDEEDEKQEKEAWSGDERRSSNCGSASSAEETTVDGRRFLKAGSGATVAVRVTSGSSSTSTPTKEHSSSSKGSHSSESSGHSSELSPRRRRKSRSRVCAMEDSSQDPSERE